MTFLHVLVLSIVQGLTEFLPVSSSAHLIFPAKLLGWPDQGLAFDVAVHLGTLMAVVLYYLADLVKISSYTIEACIKMKISPLARIGFCLIIATLPVCVVGTLFENYISSQLRDNIDVIAYCTIGFGILLGLASYVNKKMVWRNIDNIQGARSDSLRGLNYTQALVIGLFQALAVFPGVSRSGITLTAGLFMGMKSEAAARFSFLLAIPVIIASGAFEIYKIHTMGTLELQWVNLIIGAFLSFLVAIIVIHLFLKYIAKSGSLTVQYILKNESPFDLKGVFVVESNYAQTDFSSVKANSYKVELVSNDEAGEIDAKDSPRSVKKVSYMQITDTSNDILFGYEPNEICDIVCLPIIFRRPSVGSDLPTISGNAFVASLCWNIELLAGKEIEKNITYSITVPKKKRK